MPYKDPYMEYLRQIAKRIEQADHIRELHTIWRSQNKERVREQNKVSKKKLENNNPELFKKQKIARRIAGKIPMKDYCELCPEDDNKNRKMNRHHLDYDYPEIFMTICTVCHRWATLEDIHNNRKKVQGE